MLSFEGEPLSGNAAESPGFERSVVLIGALGMLKEESAGPSCEPAL